MPPVLLSTPSFHIFYKKDPVKITLELSQGRVPLPFENIKYTAMYPSMSLFDYNAQIDTTGKYFIFKYTLAGHVFFLPVVWNIEKYKKERMKQIFHNQLHQQFLTSLKASTFKRTHGLELTVPMKFKSKTFKRIFGGDQVGLRVTGNLSLEMAGQVTKYPGALSSAAQRSSVFSPKFKQNQQFQIEGNIGEKVTVSVQQNSEATFDFENTLKVHYDGDDDEIIQSIQAGNVSLNLPGTRYVSGSSGGTGLFGLKADMKLGKLKLTTIASLEKGQKNKISLKGGVEERPIQVYDYNYVKNQFFFVDSFYIPYFENWTSSMDWIKASQLEGKRILDLEVWVSVNQNQQEEAPREGVAALDPENYYSVQSISDVNVVEGEVETGNFKQLQQGVDYNFDPERGFFYLLRRSLDDNEVLGVAYRLEDGTTRGTLTSQLDSNSVLVLKLIKPRSLNPGFKRAWKLMMKNVYDLGGQIPEDFTLDIVLYRDGSNQNVQPQPPAKPFINIFGLDRKDEQGNAVEDGDGKVDVNNGWIFNRALGKLIFPSLEPFNPSDNSQFKDLHPDYHADIYNTTDQKELTRNSKFMLVFVSKQSSSTYNLGFNVMEGSEEVFFNGKKLERGKDYTIDYFTGELKILNDAATAPDANIEISYESASLFQLNKKTLLGAHARYDFDEKNFMTFTTMYLDKTTIDDKVRLGQEPTRDFIWDLQMKFQKDSRTVTRLLNKLPFVETGQNSSISLDAEVAQIRPNPNTRNNPKTGDNNGVAYIDDFEGSERATSLGISQRIWTPASIPEVFAIPRLGVQDLITYDNPDKMFLYDSSRVHVNWYLVNANIKDIWPNREVSARTGTITSVLRLRWINEKNIPRERAWWGLMRSTKNFPNQQRTKYIEILVRGNTGRLNIDIGMINEDWYIKGTTIFGTPSLRNLNTEDRNLNGLLEEGEDVGLDGVKGDDDDPNRPIGDDGEDDYKGYNETSPPYYKVNGTEGNSRAAGERYPDTEDIDGDFNLNLINSYFEYSVPLDPSDPEAQKYIAGETETGWRLIRIPIKDYVRTVGNPDTTFQRIYFVRFWVNDIPETKDTLYLDVAAFDFVGYEWESIGLAKNDSSEFDGNDSLFQVTVYNTEENNVQIENGPEPYHAPPGVEGIFDRVNNIRTKEQSLVLKALDLEPGQLGGAEKILVAGQKYDLSQYEKLKLFVHGDWNLPEENSPLYFHIRMGFSPTDYYEVIEPVYPHWDRNTLEIKLDELSATKNPKYLVNMEKSIYERTITINNKNYVYRVVGRPNINNVTYLQYILENKGENTLHNIEVWVDELRASDARKDPGTAMRVAARLNLADLVTYDGQLESKDANFHQLGQTVNASAKTSEIVSHNFSINTQNFLPRKWNLSLPINIRYNLNKNIPKFYRSSDRLTNYEYSSIFERIAALMGNKNIDAELMTQIDFNESFGYSFSFRRSPGPKDPWYLKYTLNQFNLSYNFSKINSHNFNYTFVKKETEKFTVGYNLPFGKNNFIKPFKLFAKWPILKTLKDYRIFYTPSTIQAGFNASRNFDQKKTRVGNEISENKSLYNSRNFSLTYPLSDNMNVTFRRNYVSDATNMEQNLQDFMKRQFLNGNFGTTTQMGQNFGFSYKPRRWFSFFTPTYTFNSNFNYNFSINNEARRAVMNRTNKISGVLNLDKLMLAIYNPNKKHNNKRVVPNRMKRPLPRGMNKGEDDLNVIPDDGVPRRQIRPKKIIKRKTISPPKIKNESNKKEKKKGINPIKMVLFPIWKTFYMLKSIRIDYTTTDNANYVNIDRIPELEFQFGLKTSAAVNPDTTFNKIVVPRASEHRENLRAGVQFNPIREIKISLDYSSQKSRSINNNVISNSKQTNYFTLGNNISKNNELLNYIPNWRVSISGIEKYFGLKKYFKSITVEHVRNGSHSSNSKIIQGDYSPQGENYTNQYQPFLRVSTRLKWDVDMNFSFNKSFTYNANPSGGATKGFSNSLTFNISYQKTGGMKLFFLKNKKLKNDIRFNLQFQMSSKANYMKRPETQKFEEMNLLKSYSFQPSINYRFSNNVTGEFFLKKNAQEDKRLGKSSQFEMGIKVNITLR